MRMVLHGDDSLKLNQELVAVEKSLEDSGAQLIRLTGPEEVLNAQTLNAPDLFGTQPTLIIHNIFSKKINLSKTAVQTLLASSSEFVIVQSTLLTPARTKLFPSSITLKAFKLPAAVFAFLDTFSPASKTHCAKSWVEISSAGADAHMVWGMLLKRVMQLVWSKYGLEASKIPFAAEKVRRQARQWNDRSLMSTYNQMVAFDYAFKSGSTPIPVSVKLDMIVAAL